MLNDPLLRSSWRKSDRQTNNPLIRKKASTNIEPLVKIWNSKWPAFCVNIFLAFLNLKIRIYYLKILLLLFQHCKRFQQICTASARRLEGTCRWIGCHKDTTDCHCHWFRWTEFPSRSFLRRNSWESRWLNFSPLNCDPKTYRESLPSRWKQSKIQLRNYKIRM